MRSHRPLSRLATTLITLILPTLTTQTSNNNLFTYPTSLARITTNALGQHVYVYPNGTPINHGASSSHDPFTNLTLAPGYTIRQPFTSELTFFVPILHTTSILEAFYLTAFQRAAAEFWAHAQPSKRLKISVGQLHLTLQAGTGGGSEAIPWAVVAAFAWNMWRAAKRGWTAGFVTQIFGPQGEATMVVLLAGNENRGEHVEQTFVGEDVDGGEGAGENWRAEREVGEWREPELAAEEMWTDSSELTEDLDDSDGDGEPECKRDCRRPPRGKRERGRRREGE